MLIIERHQRLMAILRERRSIRLEEVARELSVSSSTLRRDLEMLESQGIVDRTRGGVIYRGEASGGFASAGGDLQPSIVLAERMREQVDAKLAIGRAAASLVQPHQTVLLDGGSTVIFAARQITARPIQVVTNSLSVANVFVDDDQVELVVIGGTLYPRSGVLLGPIATGCLSDLHADILLFSLAGIYGNEGFNQNLAMAQVEQVMLNQAAMRVLLMDSTKFGRKSLTRVCGLDEIHRVISNDGLGPEWRERLGDRLVIAG